jgi:hypothetical protein
MYPSISVTELNSDIEMNRKRVKTGNPRWKSQLPVADDGSDSDDREREKAKPDSMKRKGKRQHSASHKANGTDNSERSSTIAAPLSKTDRYRSTGSCSSVESNHTRRHSSTCSTEDDDILLKT